MADPPFFFKPFIQVKTRPFQPRTTGIPNHPEGLQKQYLELYRYPDHLPQDRKRNRMHHKRIFA
jgi:hypothetical protein